MAGPERVVHRIASRIEPIVLGVGHGRTLLAWQDGRRGVWVEALDREAMPIGGPIALGVPVSGQFASHWRASSAFWLEPVRGGFLVATLERHSPPRGRWRLHFRALGEDGAPLGEALTVETGGATFQSAPRARDDRGLLVLRQNPTVLERYEIGPDGDVRREELASFERADALAVAAGGGRVAALVQPRGVGSTAGTLPALLWADGAAVPVVGLRRLTHPLRAASIEDGSHLVAATSAEPDLRALSIGLDGSVEALTGTGEELPAPLRPGVIGRLSWRTSMEDGASNELTLSTWTLAEDGLASEVVEPGGFYESALAWTGERFLVAWSRGALTGWELVVRSLSCAP